MRSQSAETITLKSNVWWERDVKPICADVSCKSRAPACGHRTASLCAFVDSIRAKNPSPRTSFVLPNCLGNKKNPENG